MPTRRALIVGAGTAGLACAYRLLRSDWDVVLLNAKTRLGSSELPEVLTDAALDAARRLGLLPAFNERRQPRCHLVHVDTAGVPLAVRPKPSSRRPALHQGDFTDVLGEAVCDAISLRDAEVSALRPDDFGVTATFMNGEDDWFDLVVEAGCSAETASGWSVVSGRVDIVSACAVTMNDTSRFVRLHPLRDKDSAVSFAWRTNLIAPWPTAFEGLGWIVPDLLSQVKVGAPPHRQNTAPVRFDRQNHGSIASMGNAAWNLGPHSDRENSLGLIGAELLGDALDIFADTNAALRWWEQTLRPVVRRAQVHELAEHQQPWRLPSTRGVTPRRTHTIF